MTRMFLRDYFHTLLTILIITNADEFRMKFICICYERLVLYKNVDLKSHLGTYTMIYIR